MMATGRVPAVCRLVAQFQSADRDFHRTLVQFGEVTVGFLNRIGCSDSYRAHHPIRSVMPGVYPNLGIVLQHAGF